MANDKHENDGKNRELLIGTITYAIGSFGSKILNFLIVPLYTYYILPEELGDYDLLVTTVSLLSPLLTMKISDATYRWIIKDEENELPYISATYKLLIRNCLFAAIFLLTINHFIPIWNCYYFIAILIGDRVLECLQKIVRGLKNQKLFAISGIIHTAILVSANIIKICLLGEGVTALLQSSIISLYATIIILLIAEKRLRKIDLKPSYQSEQKEMLHYSMPLVPNTLNWWIMSASDRYIIKWVLGSAANGIYSVAYKFPSVMQIIFTMFNNSWTDLAVAQLGKNRDTEKYTEKLFRQYYRFSFGLVFILIPATKLVTKLILSESYKAASSYMGFLYLGTVFQGFSTFSNVGYLQGKKTSGAAKTSVWGAAVNLVVDLFFIQHIGIYAAALSTFLGYLAMWLYRMRDVRNVFPIRIQKADFMRYLIIGVSIATVTIWTSNVMDVVLTMISLVLFFCDNRDILRSLIKKVHR